MFRTANNTRLPVVFVVVLLMTGAAEGRAIHIDHSQCIHVRALVVDSMCLMCPVIPLAASVFVLPIHQPRRLTGAEAFTLSHYESISVAQPVSRPPPFFASFF